MTGAPRAIDWDAARLRLARAADVLDAARSPAEITRILNERAADLARPVAEDGAAGPTIEVIVVEIAGERYAVDATVVVELASVRAPLLVPGTPAHVLGVTLRRGRLITVIDLCPLFDVPAPGRGEPVVVAVLARGPRAVGLLVDRILGVDRILAGDDVGAGESGAGSRRPFCRPLAGRSFAMLDIEALIDDPRVLVNQEVGPR